LYPSWLTAASPRQNAHNRPGENGYLAPIQCHMLKTEWACGRAVGFNERPSPEMYGQVYLVKLSDLFF